MANVHLPKGMRDLLPPDMRRRLHVIDTVRRVFTSFGFEPLETPAMERIETLMGKYGDEGDKLIFRVLKRGAGGKRGEVDQALAIAGSDGGVMLNDNLGVRVRGAGGVHHLAEGLGAS